MARKPRATDLESSLESLEALVERMESGELSLEESLKAFEEGVRLTRQCQQSLQQAEQKVRVLMEQSEEAEPEPFDSPDESDADEG